MKGWSRSCLWILIMTISFMGRSQELEERKKASAVKIFLGGDVMLGRGIDQAFPKSVEPVLYESYVKDARGYIQLAERENGELDLPLSYKYIWGDAWKMWKEWKPDLKLINLETSVTTSDIPWKGKGIHYRMHPENIKALQVAGIDHVSLANNHVMDWGRPGLKETLQTLKQSEIKYSGAGRNRMEAEAPSIFKTETGRVLVFSYGSPGSGIPYGWAAEKDVSGVNFLAALNEENLERVKQNILSKKKTGDVVVFSVHWGGNWGYDIPSRQQNFAHKVIDEAGADVVFGHSSHHPLGIEVYKNKLIIYGAGDFINDYEGISGHEEYRNELSLMYFAELNENGNLLSLEMIPMRIKKFKLHRAKEREAVWLRNLLKREGSKFGTSVKMDSDRSLWLEW